MYLHLGQNIIIPESSVIGVFDLDNTTCSHITRKFLSDAEKAGRIISVTDELPRSFVICDDQRTAKDNIKRVNIKKTTEMKVLLSQLSPQTLLKRTGTTRYE